mgnify:CR=1 FL=1
MQKGRGFLFFLIFSLAFGGVNEDVERLQKQVEELQKKMKAPQVKELSPEEKEKLRKQIESLKARSKEWQERLEYKDGRVIVKQEGKKEEKKEKTSLSQGEFIYIFMSSSVPISVWKTYAKNIEDFGLTDKSSLVLRGCIGGCRYIKPTLEFISKVLEIDRDRQGIKAEVWIDPLLFRRFNIQRVPCVVYVRGQELMDNTLSAGLEENIKTKGQYFISCGDWSLKYHLEELCKKSGNQNLCRIGES